MGIFKRHKHKWPKWSKPIPAVWSGIDRLTGNNWGDQNGYKQERTCETCGKYEWRKV